MVAAAISLVVGILQEGWHHGWLDGVSILIAILIILSVNTVNEAAKELQF